METVHKIEIWILIFLIFGVSACTESTNSISNETIQPEMKGTFALVNTDYQKDGCEVLLEIEEDGEKILLMPIELDDEFRIHGAQLEITFHSSKIMQSKCQVGRPIVLDSIKFIDQNG